MPGFDYIQWLVCHEYKTIFSLCLIIDLSLYWYFAKEPATLSV